MPSIEQSFDESRDATVYTINGPVTASEIIVAVEEFYATAPSKFLLFDLSHADLSGMPTEDFRTILEAAKRVASGRKGGKTAIVAPSELEFGLGRMYENFTVLWNHPVPHSVFKSRDEALDWFESIDTT